MKKSSKVSKSTKSKSTVKKYQAGGLQKRLDKKVYKGYKAVDEGRDRKADRILKKAAKLEDRLITRLEKKEERGNKKPKMSKGGSLKAIPNSKKGLSKLPKPVRNKMGYKELGGAVGEDCVSQGPGKPKKCKAGKRRRNFDAKRTAGNIAKGIGAAAGATAVALGAKFVKDQNNKKRGGVIKNKK